MNESSSPHGPFLVRTCALAAIATGVRVNSLLEMRDKLANIDESSISYHFWGSRMNPHFVHPQFHNDFASWVYTRLHDHILAEKLNVIDPTEFETLELLRENVIERIEERLDEYEVILWTKKEDRFHFIMPKLIVFESSFAVPSPEDLGHVVPLLPPSSIFYHFIDARVRGSEKEDDFTQWLKTFGDQYQKMIDGLKTIDPFFLPLSEIKQELIHIFKQAV